jgi:protease YdgD
MHRTLKNLLILGIIYALLFQMHLSNHCQVKRNPSNVFLPDDRAIVPMNVYPYNAIVTLKYFQFTCSGAIVHPRVVITNSHCILEYFFHNQSQDLNNLSVQVHTPTNKIITVKATYFQLGTKAEEANPQKTNDPTNDWAFLIFPQNIAASNQHFNATKQVNVSDQTKVRFAGYNSDIADIRKSKNCQIIKYNETKYVLHDCDSTKGSSGSPLFVCTNSTCDIVALNIGEFTETGKSLTLKQFNQSNANAALAASKWIPTLEKIISTLED